MDDNAGHSVRIDAPAISRERDITAEVLDPIRRAELELNLGLRENDPDLTITALRRIVAIAFFARQWANRLDEDKSWRTPS